MTSPELIDIIIKLTGTLVPGYLAYYILYRSNTIFLKRNRADENKTFLVALSLFNSLVGLFYLQNVRGNTWYSNIIFVSSILFLISVFLLPVAVKVFSFLLTEWLNILRGKNGYAKIESLTIFKKVFDHTNGTRVSIFDFSGKHIITGSVDCIVEDNQFDYFDVLFSRRIEDYDSLLPAEAVRMYSSAEKANMGEYTVYVDFEKKVVFHVFKESYHYQ
ncbi:hypothetical protein JZO70_14110 [Enterococcus sp. 669A]|uniref:Uncharacterized protein n=1 Tax=Candidatus Enterococcus moelleringii TaxID=2815325 RepID=A0ABS3LE46_9ENTE|nr:hypothetical protein [Enterococcus sp. 669A]MBO1307308.1 hypothetical protein [Enterococcus sp. 669A]